MLLCLLAVLLLECHLRALSMSLPQDLADSVSEDTPNTAKEDRSVLIAIPLREFPGRVLAVVL